MFSARLDLRLPRPASKVSNPPSPSLLVSRKLVWDLAQCLAPLCFPGTTSQTSLRHLVRCLILQFFGAISRTRDQLDPSKQTLEQTYFRRFADSSVWSSHLLQNSDLKHYNCADSRALYTRLAASEDHQARAPASTHVAAKRSLRSHPMSITAMPAEPHPYPIEPAPTPDSTTELRSNGFTAANGGSPSRNSSTAQSDKQGRASQSDDASSESGASSTGKRKEFSSPTIVEFSPKRRRLSQSQPQTNGHPPLRPNGNPHPLPSHNGQQQPKVNGNFEHHRKESGNSDAQLERALTNGMGQEVHSISTSPEQNHQATPAQNERYQYPEGIPEHIPQGGPGNTPSIQRTSGGGRKR